MTLMPAWLSSVPSALESNLFNKCCYMLLMKHCLMQALFSLVCASRFGCKVHCVEISEKENEDNARVTEEEKMQDLIAIHPESFCET
mgnify:FL=1